MAVIEAGERGPHGEFGLVEGAHEVTGQVALLKLDGQKQHVVDLAVFLVAQADDARGDGHCVVGKAGVTVEAQRAEQGPRRSVGGVQHDRDRLLGGAAARQHHPAGLAAGAVLAFLPVGDDAGGAETSETPDVFHHRAKAVHSGIDVTGFVDFFAEGLDFVDTRCLNRRSCVGDGREVQVRALRRGNDGAGQDAGLAADGRDDVVALVEVERVALGELVRPTRWGTFRRFVLVEEVPVVAVAKHARCGVQNAFIRGDMQFRSQIAHSFVLRSYRSDLYTSTVSWAILSQVNSFFTRVRPAAAKRLVVAASWASALTAAARSFSKDCVSSAS